MACYILTLGGVTPGPGPGQVQEQRQSVAVGDRVELDCRVTGRYIATNFYIILILVYCIQESKFYTPDSFFSSILVKCSLKFS